MVLLYRDPWLKPLEEGDFESSDCAQCSKAFQGMQFVTSCEFCSKGIMHSNCADFHALNDHPVELAAKVDRHRDKALHGFQ